MNCFVIFNLDSVTSSPFFKIFITNYIERKRNSKNEYSCRKQVPPLYRILPHSSAPDMSSLSISKISSVSTLSSDVDDINGRRRLPPYKRRLPATLYKSRFYICTWSINKVKIRALESFKAVCQRRGSDTLFTTAQL